MNVSPDLGIDELRRRYDEVVVNYSEGIADVREQKLSPRDFATVLKWFSLTFADSAQKAKLRIRKVDTYSQDEAAEALDDDMILGVSVKALERAQRRVGYDWASMHGVIDERISQLIQ